MSSSAQSAPLAFPAPSAIAELLKPVTWFPPMWAFSCGVIASGVSPTGNWALIIIGVLLSGPLVCATSQAVNDWFDRHVDAINEPQRPIPSGRMPGRWGLYVAIVWTVLSLAVATLLGPWGFGAAVIGLLLAWAYSAPATAPEAERLVGLPGLWRLLRRPGLGDGRCGDGWRPGTSRCFIDAGPALQPGCPRHHDLERLQGHRG